MLVVGNECNCFWSRCILELLIMLRISFIITILWIIQMHHSNILFSIKVLAYVGMEMEFSLLQQASNTSRLLLKNGACAVFS